MTATTSDLQRGLDYLEAIPLPQGSEYDYIYRDDVTRDYWVADGYQVEQLGELLRSDDRYTRSAAYSLWCGFFDSGREATPEEIRAYLEAEE